MIYLGITRRQRSAVSGPDSEMEDALWREGMHRRALRIRLGLSADAEIQRSQLRDIMFGVVIQQLDRGDKIDRVRNTLF